jgi:hypothetical protein
VSRDKPHGHHLGSRHRDGKSGDWTYARDDEPDANGPYTRGQVRSNLDTPPPKEK